MVDCGVCIGGGDYDGSPEFFDVTWPTARKIHRCEECKREIPKGSQYRREAGKYDGNLYCIKTCEVCAEIRDAFTCDDGAGSEYGSLWSDLTDSFSALTTGCFERLTTVAAKQYLRERWMRWKGLSPAPTQ